MRAAIWFHSLDEDPHGNLMRQPWSNIAMAMVGFAGRLSLAPLRWAWKSRRPGSVPTMPADDLKSLAVLQDCKPLGGNSLPVSLRLSAEAYWEILHFPSACLNCHPCWQLLGEKSLLVRQPRFPVRFRHLL